MQWQPKLGAPGERVTGVDELEQAMMLVLTTPERSVPLRPGFGSRLYQLVDEPVTQARPAIVREVLRALGVNEPRVRPLGVNVAHDAEDAGHLAVDIEWQPVVGGPRRSTTVVI